MESVKYASDELCMNIDTINLLKDDNISLNEISKLFSEDIQYDDDLTKSLSNITKSYIKSMEMRIKYKLKSNCDKDKLRSELLQYNKDTLPILNKMLYYSERIKDYYEEEFGKDNVQPVSSGKDNVQPVSSGKDNVQSDSSGKGNVQPVSSGKDIVQPDSPCKNNIQLANSKAPIEITKDIVSNTEEESEEEINYYNKFIETNVEKTDNQKEFIKLADLYTAFKEWFETEQYTDVCSSKNDFKEYLVSLWGKSSNGGWKGIKLSGYNFDKK